MDKFLVAEVSKSWDKQTPVENILCQQFEHLINLSHQRGYKLVDWKMTSICYLDVLTETIIAVFEKEQ